MEILDKNSFEQLLKDQIAVQFAEQFKIHLAPIEKRFDMIERRIDIRCDKLESMINSLANVQHQMGADLNDKIDTLARSTARSFKELQPLGSQIHSVA